MIYRFVQLSDIHFGQEHDGSLPRHNQVRSELIDDVARLAQARGNASMVLVVGDLAFSGKKEEYDLAGPWLDRLTNAAGCNEKSVRLVPGNHDCDRAKIKMTAKMLHRQLRSSKTAGEADNFLHRIAEEEDLSPFLQKLSAYDSFASSYDCGFYANRPPFWWHDLDFQAGIKLRLFGMNSVQVCDEEDTQGKMVLGQAQYVAVADAAHILPIVLVHHPLHWFLDKAEAEPYLHNRVHLILVGHEHISKIERVATANHERIDVYSGATNPSEIGPRYRHTYNWIEIALLENAGIYTLRVEIFARTWIPDIARFGPDTPTLNGKDSVVHEIACPFLKPLEAVSTAITTPITSAIMASNTTLEISLPPAATATPVAQPRSNVSAGIALAAKGATPMPAEEDISQLRFLFWRYLDLGQRLKVLVEADVLPPTAVKPVSQNLEHMALEKARAEGKLAAVWDSMMRLMPADKQRPNPFRTP